MADLNFVGKSFPIDNAEDKATGCLLYASDLTFANMLVMKLVLSNVAHAKILSIDISKALKIPGVKAIYHHWNTPAKQYNTYRKLPDYNDIIEDRFMYTDTARFVGDVIASVVAEDAETAAEAAEKIEFSFAPLPVIVSAKTALEQDSYPIHQKGNIVFTTEAHYKDLKHPVETIEYKNVGMSVSTQKMCHVAMETHAYLADYKNGMLTIWSPTQGIFGVRSIVCDLFGLPYNKVRVIKVPMGGSFGGKQEFIYEPHVSYAAMDLKRPVKLHLSRRDTFIGTICRTGVDTNFSVSFAKDGRIISCHVDCLVDAGGYVGNSLHMLNAMKGKLTRGYRIPDYSFNGKVVYTNTAFSGGMRGWGSPEMFTAFEIFMDKAAAELGIDPVEFRLHNVVEPGDENTANGVSLGNARGKECLEVGRKLFNWDERRNRVRDFGRFRRGVGMAYGAHNNGMFSQPSDISTMTIRMNEDGSVTLQTSLHEVGCGSVRAMQIIAAEVLGIAPDEIVVTEGDTLYTPYDLGSYGSRVTYVAGECLRKTASDFLMLLKKYASHYLNCTTGEICVRDKKLISNRSDNSISYQELATKLLINDGVELIHTETYKSRTNPGSYLANYVETEIDTFTGLVKITDFLSVNDVGRAINRQMVYNQIKGGIQMAAGYALREELSFDKNGNVKNDRLSRYHTFNAADMPNVRVELIEMGEANGPFGAKGVGEASTIAGTAAIVNAVNNALGTNLSNLPLTPEKIVASIYNQRSGDEKCR